MVKIEWDIKLSFQDVLIRPKRSTMRSRKDVVMRRTYQMVNSKQEWSGVPIIAANMDTTGTFEMGIAFAKQECVVAIHKHYSVDAWKQFSAKNSDILPFIAASSGTSDDDYNKLCAVMYMNKK